MNSQMRRIDLFCKLIGPLAISLVDGFSTQAAIVMTLGFNTISVIVEYYAIAKVLPRQCILDGSSNYQPRFID